MYRNDSDCSDACRCLSNGTLTCHRLPCLPNTECRQNQMVFGKWDIHSYRMHKISNGFVSLQTRKQVTNAQSSEFVWTFPSLTCTSGYTISGSVFSARFGRCRAAGPGTSVGASGLRSYFCETREDPAETTNRLCKCNNNTQQQVINH